MSTVNRMESRGPRGRPAEPLAPTTPEISFIVPVHNEAAIVEGSIRELHARIQRHIQRPFEIIVAENGSKDETLTIAQDLAAELGELRVLHLPAPNYGAALKQAIFAARGRFIHCDEIDICDVDFHRRALALLTGEDGGFDLVVGSKTMLGARDGRPLGRRVATRVLNGMLRVGLGFHGTDTHGLKAFRRAALLPIVEACVIDRDMFASELVVRAERAGKRMVDIPLQLKEKREPSISLRRRVPRVLRNIAQLFYVIRVKEIGAKEAKRSANLRGGIEEVPGRPEDSQDREETPPIPSSQPASGDKGAREKALAPARDEQDSGRSESQLTETGPREPNTRQPAAHSTNTQKRGPKGPRVPTPEAPSAHAQKHGTEKHGTETIGRQKTGRSTSRSAATSRPASLSASAFTPTSTSTSTSDSEPAKPPHAGPEKRKTHASGSRAPSERESGAREAHDEEAARPKPPPEDADAGDRGP